LAAQPHTPPQPFCVPQCPALQVGEQQEATLHSAQTAVASGQSALLHQSEQVLVFGSQNSRSPQLLRRSGAEFGAQLAPSAPAFGVISAQKPPPARSRLGMQPCCSVYGAGRRSTGQATEPAGSQLFMQ
jgi:hypothetical protein